MFDRKLSMQKVKLFQDIDYKTSSSIFQTWPQTRNVGPGVKRLAERRRRATVEPLDAGPARSPGRSGAGPWGQPPIRSGLGTSEVSGDSHVQSIQDPPFPASQCHGEAAVSIICPLLLPMPPLGSFRCLSGRNAAQRSRTLH